MGKFQNLRFPKEKKYWALKKKFTKVTSSLFWIYFMCFFDEHVENKRTGLHYWVIKFLLPFECQNKIWHIFHNIKQYFFKWSWSKSISACNNHLMALVNLRVACSDEARDDSLLPLYSFACNTHNSFSIN